MFGTLFTFVKNYSLVEPVVFIHQYIDSRGAEREGKSDQWQLFTMYFVQYTAHLLFHWPACGLIVLNIFES